MNGELPFNLVDTSNQFLVCADADEDRVFIYSVLGKITRSQALNLAAWIVALVDPERKQFDPLLEAVTSA